MSLQLVCKLLNRARPSFFNTKDHANFCLACKRASTSHVFLCRPLNPMGASTLFLFCASALSGVLYISVCGCHGILSLLMSLILSSRSSTSNLTACPPEKKKKTPLSPSIILPALYPVASQESAGALDLTGIQTRNHIAGCCRIQGMNLHHAEQVCQPPLCNCDLIGASSWRHCF